jgi:hypothetical protein
MLDELLTQDPDDPYTELGYPDVPRLVTRDDLVALHRELAQHVSVNQGAIPVAAARVVAELASIVDGTRNCSVDAYNARNDAVQKSVEHVIAAVRWSKSPAALMDYAKRELDAAQTWMVQAHLSSDA